MTNSQKVNDYNVRITPEFKGGNNHAKIAHAAKKWYVRYNIGGKEYKVSNGLNRIKDYTNKLDAFNRLADEISTMLSGGWLPESDNTDYYNRCKGQTLKGAIANYIRYIDSDYDRLLRVDNKTAKDYTAKLRILTQLYTDDTLLQDINSVEIINEIDKRVRVGYKDINTGKQRKPWSNKTANNVMGAIISFINWCVKEGYITGIDGLDKYKPKKEQISEAHEPLTEAEMGAFMAFLKDNKDKYYRELLMCQIVYYTCLRPIEIRRLKVGNFLLDKGKYGLILIKGNATKNGNNDTIVIPKQLRDILDALDIANKDKDRYLFSGGRGLGMWGKEMVGRDVIQRKINSLLKKQGYINATCYSFKHYANIMRIVKDGWDVADVMAGNRHANISETTNYLRRINKYIDRDKLTNVSGL